MARLSSHSNLEAVADSFYLLRENNLLQHRVHTTLLNAAGEIIPAAQNGALLPCMYLH